MPLPAVLCPASTRSHTPSRRTARSEPTWTGSPARSALTAASTCDAGKHAGPQQLLRILERGLQPMLRVCGVEIGIDRRNRPSNCRSAYASLNTRTRIPVANCASSCCGREKFTYTGESDWSDTIGFPVSRYSPRFTRRMPRLPGEWRADGLLVDVARMASASALVLLQVASALSSSDWTPCSGRGGCVRGRR